jgi:uncharacterized membrane protein YedE/YeeE
MIHDILMALLGGVLIGLSASGVLLLKGRVCGISGFVGTLLNKWNDDSLWILLFLAGLLAGGVVLLFLSPETLAGPEARSVTAVAGAGALVGFGTRLGNGCTSGHGICGLSRFSPRSLVATLSFMATGFITATLIGFFMRNAT